LLIGAADEVGFTPTIILESNESRRIRRLVARGLGVAILPRSHAVDTSDAVAVARLVDPSLARDITLAWRAGRRLPPAVAEFLMLARETFSPEELADWQRRRESGRVSPA
jgi:DNA-binding transcriptional LysR family regulator